MLMFLNILLLHDLSALCCCVVLVTQPWPTLTTPWTVAHQTPLSMEFSRQEYWNGLPFPSLEGLPDPGIEPRSPITGGFFTSWAIIGAPSPLHILINFFLPFKTQWTVLPTLPHRQTASWVCGLSVWNSHSVLSSLLLHQVKLGPGKLLPWIYIPVPGVLIRAHWVCLLAIPWTLENVFDHFLLRICSVNILSLYFPSLHLIFTLSAAPLYKLWLELQMSPGITRDGDFISFHIIFVALSLNSKRRKKKQSLSLPYENGNHKVCD